MSKKLAKPNHCPECGADEFITEPNQYDILTLSNGEPDIRRTELFDCFDVFCRECGKKVDLDGTRKYRKVILVSHSAATGF